MDSMKAHTGKQPSVHGNSTDAMGRLSPAMLMDLMGSRTTYISIIMLMVSYFLLQKLSTPRLDPREPPVIKPKVPFIGHIYSLLTKQGDMYADLYKKKNLSIGTLPMLGGKMYALWSPALIQSALRSKALSFDPFIIAFGQRMTGMSDEEFPPVKGTNLVPDFLQAVHASMVPHHLHRMNATALNYIGARLNAIGKGELRISSVYVWLKDLMTQATAEALYGEANPLRGKPELVEDLWNFEGDLTLLMANIYPSITARKAFQARARIGAALNAFYAPQYGQNEDAAEMTRARARVLRNYGVPVKAVGAFEIALLHVATTNTIPTTFWFTVLTWDQPKIVARVRDEMQSVVELTHDADGKRVATIDISVLEGRCPYLVAAYREAIRASNHQLGQRRVMRDTEISDGEGRTYLLKEGTDLAMPAGVSHMMADVWGGETEAFDPDRFYDVKPEMERKRKQGYIPFGGGKHLCPGRAFAFAENLGFLSALCLGFEMDGVVVPEKGMARMSTAIYHPVNDGKGGEVVLRRRKGWEDVTWKFRSSA